MRSQSNNKASTPGGTHYSCREAQQESKGKKYDRYYKMYLATRTSKMFPYSKKPEKLLHVFVTFTDRTRNNMRFKTTT
jgi:hypothetical protein